MRKKSREEKNITKAARKERRAEFKRFRAAFLKRHVRAIAVSAVVLMSVAVCFGTVISIVDAVFTSMEVTIGETAESVLSYNKPASKILRTKSAMNLLYGLDTEYDVFQQASLPIGNGDLGATIYGETDVERLVFNEKTLWSGGPTVGQTDYNGDNFTGVAADGLTESERFYAIQQSLLNGDTKTATKLFNGIQGNVDNKGSYLNWGNVYLDFGHKFISVKNYERALNVDTAVASVSYDRKGMNYKREYLASNVDNVLAIRITSSGKALDFSVAFPSSQDGAAVTAGGNGIACFGELTDNGLKYYARLTAVTDDGSVTANGDKLTISGTADATIFISAATDYKQDFPIYRTGETSGELAERVNATVTAAANKGYDAVKADHIADYTSLYNRVSLNLGGERPSFSTDTLVYRYKTPFLKNPHRKYLEQLLYNYGRYLLISSSRANSQLPANLQGLWNETNEPAWQSDYHLNINLQMNYWATYNTNLAECASPLVDFVSALREPGRITAKTYTATAAELAAELSDESYGFVAHTESNPYGHTTPGNGQYVKAMWSQAAVAWLMQNLYEGYEYSLDKTYLAEIYPIMKEALLYFERTMVTYQGRLVTAPAYSPEHGPITAGNTYEQSLIWQLLNDTVTAAKILNLDEDKQHVWLDMMGQLNPIELGSGGQIKEWYDETYNWSMGTPFHRHTSNLLGLFPGDLINKDLNPEWLAAAKVTLNWRGNETTGWAMGQRINTLARLGDSSAAYKMVKKQLTGGIYPNLFDAHPPFQIDGNFGYTAGVTEMLMQSNLGYIELLPALPDEWSKGNLSGIVARGNFTLSYEWENKTVNYADVTSNAGGECAIRLTCANGYAVFDENGSVLPFTLDNGLIRFNTEIGHTYRITKLA